VKLVLASSNLGKLREIRNLLAGSGNEIVNQSELDIGDAIESGNSFTENALIKARYASAHSGIAALADDSGLEVDYLEGKPGIYSARFAGPNATDEDNIRKLLTDLQGVRDEQRTARFHCVIALVLNPADDHPVLCHGVWEGRILDHCSGDNGFGYDPVFYVPELGSTSASLKPEIKNIHSHRAMALKKLSDYLL
jgi:XTP/dITP diphosphohydrolase